MLSDMNLRQFILSSSSCHWSDLINVSKHDYSVKFCEITDTHIEAKLGTVFYNLGSIV